MGNACCRGGNNNSNVPNRIVKSAKPLKVSVTGQEAPPQMFGQALNEDFFKVNNQVKESIKVHGLYKFEKSQLDLHGSDMNPVKRGENDEYIYEGQMIGNRMHGKGQMLTKAGDLYVCPFLEDYAQGIGAVYFANGNYFFGKIVRGDLDSGQLTSPNGQVYVGEFRNLKRNGKGNCIYADGSKYEGNWLEDMEHGNGRVVTEGVWEKGKKVSTKKATPDSFNLSQAGNIGQPKIENVVLTAQPNMAPQPGAPIGHSVVQPVRTTQSQYPWQGNPQPQPNSVQSGIYNPAIQPGAVPVQGQATGPAPGQPGFFQNFKFGNA